MATKVLAGRLHCLLRAQATPLCQQEAEGPRQHRLHCSTDIPIGRVRKVNKVTANCFGLVWKSFNQSLLILLWVGRYGKIDSWIDESLEVVGHLVPLKRFSRQKVKQRAAGRAWLHVAHVMNSNIPTCAVAPKYVRQAPSF